MPYLSILLIAAGAVFFYRAAEFENESTWLWSGLSVAISVVILFWLHWTWFGVLLGQVGLFAGITIYRISRKP